jgi:uncharacterized DUF497 family protein
LFAAAALAGSTSLMLTFEWNAHKSGSNLAKHGVSFEEAATVFGDPVSITIPDPAHSQTETRFIILGRSHQGKLLVVIHTERGDNIRIISARHVGRRERKSYEEAIS